MEPVAGSLETSRVRLEPAQWNQDTPLLHHHPYRDLQTVQHQHATHANNGSLHFRVCCRAEVSLPLQETCSHSTKEPADASACNTAFMKHVLPRFRRPAHLPGRKDVKKNREQYSNPPLRLRSFSGPQSTYTLAARTAPKTPTPKATCTFMSCYSN